MSKEFNPEIGKLTQFTSENQPENAGRKKNRFKETQKDYDLSLDDMRQMMMDLLSMKPQELKELLTNEDEPIFKHVIAKAIIKSGEQGNWTQVNYMADRLFGKATEKHELTGKDGVDLPISIIIKDAETTDNRSTSEVKADIQQST